MVQKFRHRFNKIFNRISICSQKIFKSSGLVFVAQFISQSGLVELFERRVKDSRNQHKVQFPLSEVLVYILLQIIDGSKRVSHFAKSANVVLFRQMFRGELPHPTAVLNALKANKLLYRLLGKVMLRYALTSLIAHCQKFKIRKIKIDTDQSSREIHGRQENVCGGYFANKPKNTKGFQFRIWAVRGMKILLKADLLPGNTHSQTGVIADFKLILRTLKKAGIIGCFIGDSGFYSAEICDLIEDYGHEFIFAVPQQKSVRRRGKYAKNKRHSFADTVVIKEGKRPETGKFRHAFREIYIQVLTYDGQLWFEFASDRFTNILITNKTLTAENIYKLYRGHAVIETIIEELKNDFGTGIAHAGDFHVNAAMTCLTAIAYNVKNGFIDKFQLSSARGERIKLSTLQSRWLHLPGMLVNHGNRSVMRIPAETYAQVAYLQKIA